MSQRVENECSFAVDVGILSFTFNEALLCQKFSLYCFCCATAFTNVACSFNRHLLWDAENTGSASYNDYFVYALHCWMRLDPVTVIWRFWYPNNIPVGRSRERYFTCMVLRCYSCFPILVVNLAILNHFNNKDFSLFRVNWNIFVFKLLHLHPWGRYIRLIQLKLAAFCLSAEQNITNQDGWGR